MRKNNIDAVYKKIKDTVHFILHTQGSQGYEFYRFFIVAGKIKS